MGSLSTQGQITNVNGPIWLTFELSRDCMPVHVLIISKFDSLDKM